MAKATAKKAPAKKAAAKAGGKKKQRLSLGERILQLEKGAEKDIKAFAAELEKRAKMDLRAAIDKFEKKWLKERK